VAERTDDFNRADANLTASGNWTTLLGLGWQIESNRATGADNDSATAAIWNSSVDNFGDDQFSEVLLAADGNMNGAGLILRGTDSSNYYAVYTNQTNVYFVRQTTSDGFETMESPAISVAVNDVIRASVAGQDPCVLKFWKNGTAVHTVTDSLARRILTGQPGLWGNRNYGAWRFDDARLGDGDGTGGGGGPPIENVGLIVNVRRSRLG
jgi:hypothetical protein